MGAKTTKEIAEWVCNTGYDAFDSDLVNFTKGLALTHLGMTLAGAIMPFGKIVIQYVKDYQCPAEAGVTGGGFRTLAEYAALVNGSLAHTTELETVSFPDGLFSCGAWPTVFALGEKLKLPGKDVIEAFIVGYEVASRLGVAGLRAVGKGWANAPGCLTIGSAVMATKMLKLNVEQTAWAMSIAASQATGIVRQTGSGAHLIEAGFAGRNGICAAMLAKLGYTGSPTILEGPGGFMDLWADQPDFDLPLGDGFRVAETSMKKYPCCSEQQRNIDGLLDLIAEHNISYDDVKSVEIEVNSTFADEMQYSDPQNAAESQFSFEHSAAACLFDRQAFLPAYTDEKARDPKFREARKKVTVTVHPEWESGYCAGNSPLTIRLKDGTEYKKLCVYARGDAGHRLSRDEVTKLYMDCIDFAGIISHEQAEKAAEMTWALDRVEDVSELMNIFTFPEEQ